MDSETTVQDLRLAVKAFIEDRDWGQYHTPKNLAISIAIEAAEIMEHFQWLTPQESIERLRQDEKKSEAADELADVLIYCISLANQLDVDISAVILDKLDRNQGRFPIGAMPS